MAQDGGIIDRLQALQGGRARRRRGWRGRLLFGRRWHCVVGVSGLRARRGDVDFFQVQRGDARLDALRALGHGVCGVEGTGTRRHRDGRGCGERQQTTAKTMPLHLIGGMSRTMPAQTDCTAAPALQRGNGPPCFQAR